MHVVQKQPTVRSSKSGLFRVHQIPAAKDNFVWLLEYETGKCAAIDGPSATEVLDYCSQHQLRITTILNTHIHGDHIGINHDLARRRKLDGVQIYGAAATADRIPYLTDALNDGDSIHLGAVQGTVLLTEGHIKGHLSFVFDEFLFCGDTLFTCGCGYLFEGDYKAMYRSLQRLASLSPNSLVCCAHEYTEDNIQFALSIDPNNQALIERYNSVSLRRKEGYSVVPSHLQEELDTNPFLRASSELEFKKRRELKNTGEYRRSLFPSP